MSAAKAALPGPLPHRRRVHRPSLLCHAGILRCRVAVGAPGCAQAVSVPESKGACGRWCQLVTGAASPRRQLLGGPGWEGRLPHVPTAEGQEDGRPPAAPLRLLQQDRAFRGESPRRPEVAPSAHPLGGVFRGASGGIHSRGRERPSDDPGQTPHRLEPAQQLPTESRARWGKAPCRWAVLNPLHPLLDRRGPRRAHAGRLGHR